MTVAELIAKLQGMPQDAVVVNDGETSDTSYGVVRVYLRRMRATDDYDGLYKKGGDTDPLVVQLV